MHAEISVFLRAALYGSLLAAGTAQAAYNTLTFEGLQNIESIGEYYNGGVGGSGSGPGPNFGVVFSSNAWALISINAGGDGNFANEPSPNTIMYFEADGAIFMTVPAGFDTGFSFHYSSLEAASVSVFDGLDGTGNVLASFALPANHQAGGCQPSNPDEYCHWDLVDIPFAGTGKSIGFGGEINFVGFDDVTFGRASPDVGVPEPDSLALVALGLGLAGFAAGRRKRSC